MAAGQDHQCSGSHPLISSGRAGQQLTARFTQTSAGLRSSSMGTTGWIWQMTYGFLVIVSASADELKGSCTFLPQ